MKGVQDITNAEDWDDDPDNDNCGTLPELLGDTDRKYGYDPTKDGALAGFAFGK